MAAATAAGSYAERRDRIEAYFDRTAADAWARLTSDAPVGRIRRTVRAGRDEMRRAILDWLPADLRGRRVLDAGCGTGAFAGEAARRGAEVVAVDLSPTLVDLARERAAARGWGAGVSFRVGDMLDPEHGRFDHVVAMDSLIHYALPDALRALAGLAARADRSILFTFAPRTSALAAMHAVGRLFPRGDRAPAVEPVAEARLLGGLRAEPGLTGWQASRTRRVARGFYISQAMELVSP
jgi:magnesium-protoporphyrin O-methyltransferase